MLWVQQRVRNNDLDLYYVPGDKNPADVFTKPNIPHERMDSLLRSMGCTFSAGRPASAPSLRREGGTNAFSLQHTTMRTAFPREKSSLRWADQDDQGGNEAQLVLLWGLPHQRSEHLIASMSCEAVEVDWDEIRAVLPQETEEQPWRLSEHLPEELVEHEEAPDPMLQRGLHVGRAGNGRSQIT